MIKQEIKNVKAQCNPKELRMFSLTLGIFLGLIAAFLFWKEKGAVEGFAFIAGAFLLLGLVLPIALQPIYLGWMSFAVVMGFFMTRIILSLMFCLVFAPAGIMIQILRKDPLHQKIEVQRDSYWVKREHKRFDPVTVENQY